MSGSQENKWEDLDELGIEEIQHMIAEKKSVCG